MRLVATILALIRNGIPAAGVILREWSAPNALLLYLGENVVLAILAALTVRILAPAEELIEGKMKSRRDSLKTFFLVAVPFTFGAAVFTFAVILIRGELTIDPRELTLGFTLILIVQLLAFALGLRSQRGITLAQGEDVLVGVLGRVFLLALGVWAGLLLAFFVSKAFVIPFMILKTIVDVWGFRVEGLKRRVVVG